MIFKQKTKLFFRYSFVSSLILILTISTYLSYTVSGATFTFNQTSWSGGITANTANHTSNQSGWNQYSAKDANIATVNAGADIELTATALTAIDDGAGLSAKTDYAAGTSPQSVTISADGTSVYTVNFGSATVSMYARNTSTGTLSAKTDYVTGTNPSDVTISTDGNSVYVTNYSSNTVSMYARNTSTGTLSAKTDYATGSNPQGVTISADGNSVYVTNYSSNTVSMYARNTSTGTLSAKTDYATGPGSFGVTISADGTSVYVTNFGDWTVSMYSRNTTDGTLSAKTDYTTKGYSRGVTISADGTSVYVANDNATNGSIGTVSMYPRNTTTGTLSARTDYVAGLLSRDVTISPDGTSVYATNYGSATVSMYTRNTTTGTLSAKTDYTTGTSPYGVTISPDGTSVYTANYSSATVSMFSRVVKGGALGFELGTLSNTSVSGSGSSASVGITSPGILSAKTDYTTGSFPLDIAISADGTSVYIPNNNASTVSLFARNTGTGAISGRVDYAAGANPYGVAISADGTSVYVTNQTSNTVSMYARNTGTGTLSAKTDYATGTAPARITISADGTSVYVTNASSAAVSMYARNTSTGTLSAKTDYATGTTPDKVAISADGTSVYVTNRTSNTVSMYARNTGDGTLSVKTDYATGTTPYGVIISADGTSVYVTNSGSTTISMFARNTSTGTLSAKTDYATGSGPRGVTISADGNSVYVTNYNANTVSMYLRNASTGTLSAKTDYGTDTWPYGVTISADGNSVYVVNFGVNSLSLFPRSLGSLSGTFTSAVVNTGARSVFTTLAYTTTLNGQTLTMDARAGNTATPDGTWTAWQTGITSGGSIASLSDNRYFQYRANFSSASVAITPTLDSVTINYGQYGTGTLTSSKYNSESFANLMSRMSWTASNTSGTETVQFQVRSSSDGITWSSWCGYEDCSGSTYFDTGENNTALGGAHPLQTGNDDQYLQYKLTLSSGGGITPTLNDATIQYVVNASPEFDASFDVNGIRTSQISSDIDPNWGKVKIEYRIRDADTTTGSSTPNEITPTFAYNTGAGWNTINSSFLTAGSTTNKSVDEVSYTTYTTYWDVQADTNIGDIYDATVDVRVTANDNEAANNTTSVSDTISIDTKVPVLGGAPLIIDASTIPATLTLSASDDSSFNMKIGLVSDASDGTYVAYNASATKSLATNPDTVYVKFRDAYGNETGVSSASSAETPTLVMIQDISNVPSSEWRLFISWQSVSLGSNFSNYKIYRSLDNISYSLLTQINTRTLNYYIDETPLFDTTYYYKISMTDTVGNVSWFSSSLTGKANGTQDAGEGGGGSETTPPIVSSVSSSAISTTQATITWDTDELSDSTVGFDTIASSFIDEMGVATFSDNAGSTGIHSVTLSGLAPNTTYYYQVKSSDPSGNEAIDDNGGGGYTFTTTDGPAITGVALESAANTQATIVWNTDVASSTYVSYATSISGGALVAPTEVGTGTLVTSHSHTITGLTTGTSYYFSVKSVDGSANIATNNNAGLFYQFTTPSDSTGPVLSSIQASVTTHDKSVLTWISDEQSNSQVKYSLTSGGPYTVTPATATYSEDHYVILTGLTDDTTYFYQVVSSDLSTNATTSSEGSFITLKDPTFQHDPLSSITSVSASLVTDTNAIIVSTTDQPAMCTVEYGTTPGSYTATPVSEILYNENHSIRLSSLLFSTTYYYRLTCEDNLGTSVQSGEESFTTTEEQLGNSERDNTGPSVGSDSVNDITGTTATVTWTTSEVSSGFVYYGIETFDENISGEGIVNSDTANYVTDHSVKLEGLLPNTKYLYKVSSADADGNITTGDEGDFTTTDAPFFENIKETISADSTSVVLSWTTPVTTDSIVEYGTQSGKYPKTEKNTKKTKEHSVEVGGLSEGFTYVYRIKGTDQDNITRISAGNSFTVPSRPVIQSIDTKDKTTTEVTIDISTNTPTSALITLTKDGESAGSQGSATFDTNQSVPIRNLEPNSQYDATVTVRSENGTERTENLTFETEKDSTAPEVQNFKSEVALSITDVPQIALTFKTSEPALTKIFYKKGRLGDEKELRVSDTPTENHAAVTKEFDPGATYFFHIEAKDQAGNTGSSLEYALSTPRKRENIIQIISKNFGDIFGWVRL